MNETLIMSQERIFSDLINALLLISFMVAVFFTWFFIHKARAKERLLMIEKGFDISNLAKSGKFKISIPWLKIGFVLAGASIGATLGIFLREFKIYDMPGPLLFTGGALGIIIAFLRDKPKEQN